MTASAETETALMRRTKAELVDALMALRRRLAGGAGEATSEIMLLDAIENSSEAFALYDADDRLVHCNGRFKELYRYSDEEARPGARRQDLDRLDFERGIIALEDESEADFRARLKSFRAAGQGSFELKTSEGRWYLIRERATAGGGIVVIQADITDLKETEEALRDVEQRYALAMRSTNEMIYDVDLESGETTYSSAVREKFGLPVRASSSASWTDLIHPDDVDRHHAAHIALYKGETDRLVCEYRVRDAAGEWRWVVQNGVVLRDEDGKAFRFVGSTRDVHERKRTEEELRIAKAHADGANRAKSEFLSSMSHELRTPLNAIIGFSQYVAEDEADPLTEEQQECVAQVMKAGRHLLELIDDVLDLSKIEIGAVALSMEPVGVSEVVGECIELTISLAARRSIRLDDRVTAKAPPPIRVDRTRFKQVLLNFLSNAVKYNREGGSIVLDCTEKGDHIVRVSITDTGDGIPEEKIGGLFDPFDRLGAENSDIEGTGIGLTITKRLVEQMAGDIGVDSSQGEGSTFWVDFPVAGTAAEDAGDRPVAAPSVEAADGGGTVLYVEDNPANLQLMRKIMGRHKQYILIDAPTAELGLELARQRRPDIVIMDINLPGMDGFAALAKLRRMPETRDIPVVALSAAAMPRDIEKGRAAGFVGYLTKPVDAKVLMTTIDKALDGE